MLIAASNHRLRHSAVGGHHPCPNPDPASRLLETKLPWVKPTASRFSRFNMSISSRLPVDPSGEHWQTWFPVFSIHPMRTAGQRTFHTAIRALQAVPDFRRSDAPITATALGHRIGLLVKLRGIEFGSNCRILLLFDTFSLSIG